MIAHFSTRAARHGAAIAVAAVGLLAAAPGSAAQDPQVERGAYLATAGDCVACHTAPGGKPFAGGLYLPTPFGQISTPNITPDVETGIGAWTDEQFYRAMHDGIGRDGEYLYPAFPFPWYTKVTREDVLAIKAYLFSLPPESAPREPMKLAFPFNIRAGLAAWRTLFFRPGDFASDPAASEAVNRGAYLVEGLGHCGECHSRNKLFGASTLSGQLQGGEIEGWFAPNIRASGHDGLAGWSEAQLATYLKTGAEPGLGIAVGPMAETIERSLSRLSDADLHAMAAYLKSGGGAGGGEPRGNVATADTDAQVYLSRCASCHGVDGRGVNRRIPALAGNGMVRAEGPENVIRVALGGLPAQRGFALMPAVGASMTDAEIAAAVNYVRSAWGNDTPPDAQPGMVAELRAQTTTMLAGNLPEECPAPGDGALARQIAAMQVRERLAGVDTDVMLEKIAEILPPLRSTAASEEQLVDALTTAYCPEVVARKADPAGRAELFGNFSALLYAQLAREDSAHK